ncbi:DNA primase, partial [Candidatus Woesearchaeota archaeon]|nr:DNA primase [Candidatus Woesearchaeota archaeon]
MGKISPVSIKYIVHANLRLTGVADKPDIIGAIFGQTEGLLGSDLELRELQKSGRIGRIDVKLETKGGKTSGEILLPSSMGKSETAIVGAALETIERVGPCNAKIKVNKIEDVRVSKRNFILDRAKGLLQNLVEDLPDSQEFTNQVTRTVRTLEITEYGKDRLPAGPMIDNSDEIIIVEGRADVLNLLRYGIRNVIGLNGTKISKTIINLIRKKVVTLFIDGDRGGKLIIRKLADLADLDFVARAPDGKEVEELTLKEIHKALRLKAAWEQVKADLEKENGERKTKSRTRSRIK